MSAGDNMGHVPTTEAGRLIRAQGRELGEQDVTIERLVKALRFAHEIVMDELREGFEGHGGIMFSLEPIIRTGLGLPNSAEFDLLEPKSEQFRQALTACLANTYTMLMVAGWKDDELLQRIKAARDSARNAEEERAKP